MMCTINFNDQFELCAIEICNVVPNHTLPEEPKRKMS